MAWSYLCLRLTLQLPSSDKEAGDISPEIRTLHALAPLKRLPNLRSTFSSSSQLKLDLQWGLPTVISRRAVEM